MSSQFYTSTSEKHMGTDYLLLYYGQEVITTKLTVLVEGSPLSGGQ